MSAALETSWIRCDYECDIYVVLAILSSHGLLLLSNPVLIFQGAFLSGKNVNYRAILETALDIARGMYQLHELDIVHSDLKARNSGQGLSISTPTPTPPHHRLRMFSSRVATVMNAGLRPRSLTLVCHSKWKATRHT